MKKTISLLIFIVISFNNLTSIFGQVKNDKMNVYFISGLGADKRVFQNLDIDPKFNVINVEWVDPKRKETIEAYAGRLISQIDTTKPFQIVGLSFGGMMATVISEQIRPEQIILISSNSVGRPIGKFYRGLIGFVLLSPFSAPFLKSTNKFTYKLFGTHTPDEKALLKSILKDTDSKFLKWALKAIGKWKHPNKSPIAYQINGSADKMVKLEYVDADKVIEGGEHFMVLSKAEEISKVINAQLLKKYQ
ncbi:MAG: alpha/beta hydrolase [Saprospiraceae bacterium]|nr:alpha/beta hydrolase [Candidatus Brachybacter algidus]MBK8746855.1 alpha/beta hydrolase [Candidatus Brachybacter algidus]